MLQPHAPRPADIKTARIVWMALTASTLIYVFILFQLQKITGVWMPEGEILPLQKLGLSATLILAGTFFYHSAKIVTIKSFQEKFVHYILVWALNEMVVIIAFAGSFLSETGNGFFMLVNTSLAILANIVMFPKEK